MVVMTELFGQIEVPDWVVDWKSFREWVHSGVLPEKLKVHFVRGQIWIDDMEELFTHNRVKTALTRVLDGLCETEDLGMVFSDGVRLSNVEADLNNEPDAIFVSADAVRNQRVTFWASEKTGAEATEMVGSPDLVVEVVSRTSVAKDYDHLLEAYFAAGVREYWLIDARDRDDLQFTIHRRGPKVFVAVRKAKGWSKSDVFGRSFRLVAREKFGLSDYALETK